LKAELGRKRVIDTVAHDFNERLRLEMVVNNLSEAGRHLKDLASLFEMPTAEISDRDHSTT